MNRRVFLYGAAGVAAMAGGGWAAWRASSRRVPSRQAGGAGLAGLPEDVRAVYALELPDAAGRSHAVAGYRGKPLVVNFWATWCPPCVKEMPDLDALHKRYAQVQFLGIGIDTAANIRQFSEKIPVGYPLLVAGPSGIELLRRLGNPAGGLPFTVVFDAQGQVARRILGQVQPDDLARTLDGFPPAA